MRAFSLCLGLLILTAIGCGNPAPAPKAAKAPMAMQEPAGAKKDKGAKQANQKPEAEKAVARKIIYTAQVHLLVDKLDDAAKRLLQLVKEQEGYLAKSDAQTTPGEPRQGHWTVRIPVAHFDAFMEAVAGLGEVQTRKIDSDDITDSYYDLAARLKNKQREEDRLLDLLKKATATLQEILTVEENLSRVRAQIEQMQGQLQRWDKETELATITVRLNERASYVPTTPPAYSTTIGRTFFGSLDVLVDFGKGLFLVIVALISWLPLIALVLLAVIVFNRRRRARRVRQAST